MALAAQRAPVLLWAAMLGPHHPLGEELPSIQYAQQRKSEVLRYSAANWRNGFFTVPTVQPSSQIGVQLRLLGTECSPLELSTIFCSVMK